MAPNPVIIIKYWGITARASGLFRMCAEAGVDWQHVTSRSDMGCAFFGAKTGNLAPPVIEDLETGVVVSQAAACHQYLGRKFGFDKGIDVPELAVQHLNDLSDLHSDFAYRVIGEKDVRRLQAYLEGDRYKRHLEAINRNIVGPYYFGADPTYVDFAVTSYLDMCEGKWLTPLLNKTGGDTIAAYAPKLRSIATAIRNLPSSRTNEKIRALPPVPHSLVLTEEFISTWEDQSSL